MDNLLHGPFWPKIFTKFRHYFEKKWRSQHEFSYLHIHKKSNHDYTSDLELIYNFLISVINYLYFNLAIFGIWEYCHKHKVNDSTSVALLTAAALTSPDRPFVRAQASEQDRLQMDCLHNNIVSSLQNHLMKTHSVTSSAFSKGKLKYLY